MRPTMALATLRCAKLRFAGPLALAIAALLLGPSSSTLGNGEAPAVWVPATPGAVEAGQPFVLVPYLDSLAAPQPAVTFQPWAPDYLTAPLDRPAAVSPVFSLGAADDEPDGAASVPLSQVLRDADWRRDTARRLRAQPNFQPRF